MQVSGSPPLVEGPPNGLEVSRPPARVGLLSLYARLVGKTSVHFAQLGGSAPPSC